MIGRRGTKIAFWLWLIRYSYASCVVAVAAIIGIAVRTATMQMKKAYCLVTSAGVTIVLPCISWWSHWNASVDRTPVNAINGYTVIKWVAVTWFKDYALRWRHNERDSVSNHQPHDCLLNRLFRRRSKKTSKLRVTGLCVDRWIPRTNGQLRGKCFHLMTSSWHQDFSDPTNDRLGDMLHLALTRLWHSRVHYMYQI